MARERDETVPLRDAMLANVRNALEHLDEAALDDESVAAAGNDPKANRSLRQLPGACLRIGDAGGPLLFELVDPEECDENS